ncbi:MAG TPA: hypothetical protein VES65_00495 [Solirubrobacteraceae bacterium]|nr:hypothetical protein [Solirubrobacteraceae bacterium]
MPSSQISEPRHHGAIQLLDMSRRPLLTAPDRGSLDREHLIDRLHQLRKLVPAFAEELAGARRQTAKLRLENRRLLDRVRRLQRQHGHAAHPTRGPAR